MSQPGLGNAESLGLGGAGSPFSQMREDRLAVQAAAMKKLGLDEEGTP